MTLYRAMVKDGYDFYENTVLNSVFKKIVSIRLGATKADDAIAAASATDLSTMARKRQKAHRNKINRKHDKSIRDNFNKMDSDSNTISNKDDEYYSLYDEDTMHHDILEDMEVLTTAVLNELNNM